jgi:hypothetical protein
MRTNWSDPFAAQTPTARADSVRTLLIAAVVTIALYFVPYAGYITYPIRLLVTFIHEGSHALMAILTGGSVQAISVSPDGSGLTTSLLAGWLPSILVSSAGYLGASLFGAGMIGMLRRGASANRLLLVTAVAVALVTFGALKGILWPFSAGGHPAFSLFFALFWGILLTLGLFIASRKLDAKTAGWVAAFIGVQCMLNALFDLKTLFALSVSTMAGTDAMNMARLTLIPAPIWAAFWMALSIGMLWFVLRPTRAQRAAYARR